MPVSSEKSDVFFYRGDKKELIEWLKGLGNWNFGSYLRDDKRGNPMIGILMDWKPDSDWSMPDKVGLIIVNNFKGTPEEKETKIREFQAWLSNWARSNGNYMGY